jgi:hypothetical protein
MTASTSPATVTPDGSINGESGFNTPNLKTQAQSEDEEMQVGDKET